MTPKLFSYLLSILLVAQTLIAPASAATTKDSVVRNAGSWSPAVLYLARDVYRTEQYQSSYTEEVPYTDTETYYEDVPYQDYESYTDYEDYYERERVCKTITEYDEKCEVVRKCESRYEVRCERKRVCSLNMPASLNFAIVLFGADISRADDKDELIRRKQRERREREEKEREERDHRDRDRRENADQRRREKEERDRRDREDREKRCHKEVCEKVKVGEDCRDERVCKRIPRRIEKCEYQQVRKTRPVTKYRWVTKYRQEQRTRTVTRYRTETRCCVTKERSVFDHTFMANVEVRFPVETVLVGTEVEKFNIELSGYDANASVRVVPVSSIYKYEPQISREGSDKFIIDMKLVPTYQPSDLGEETLSKFQISTLGNIVQMNFEDMGTVAKVQTSYELSLFDNATGAELGHWSYDPHGQAKVRWELPLTLAAGTEVKAHLVVGRTGLVISGPVDFAVDKVLRVQEESKYDVSPYMDKTQVGKFSLGGALNKLTIYFRDLTKDIPQVKSEYTYKVSLIEKTGARVLAERIFLREHLKVDVDGRIPLAAAADFGISKEDLALLKPGKTIVVEGTVKRIGTRFPQGMYEIPKKVTLGIE